jgi:hypothetical protein
VLKTVTVKLKPKFHQKWAKVGFVDYFSVVILAEAFGFSRGFFVKNNLRTFSV